MSIAMITSIAISDLMTISMLPNNVILLDCNECMTPLMRYSEDLTLHSTAELELHH